MKMKEITFLVPDDSTELVTELVGKLGGSIEKKKAGKSSETKKDFIVSKRTNGNALPILKKNTDSVIEKVNIKPQKKVSKSNKKQRKKRLITPIYIDHTYLFGKWKDFDIDARKLREESW